MLFGDRHSKNVLQVYMSDDHRSLLCFLCWEDGDLSRNPVDHENYAHAFGDISSPS